MPLVNCRKLCPGNAGRKCNWCTDIQRGALEIKDNVALCEICLASVNGKCDIAQLFLRLALLLPLDLDLFCEARREMPTLVYDSVGVMIMVNLTSLMPYQKSAREMQRRTYLMRALNYLTEDLWKTDSWHIRICKDTMDLCKVEVLMRAILPFAVRGMIANFLIGNLDALYGCICKVKVNLSTCYRSLFFCTLGGTGLF